MLTVGTSSYCVREEDVVASAKTGVLPKSSFYRSKTSEEKKEHLHTTSVCLLKVEGGGLC